MITDIPISNIFRPRNDWYLVSQRCKKVETRDKYAIQLAEAIQKETGLNPLKNIKSRKREICDTRKLFMAMMAMNTKQPYRKIGRMVGKDHSTVTHTMLKTQDIYDTDEKFRQAFDRITELVKNIKIY
jgi:chromosomal replication initiation ATPase DnaA